jgi:environmental stress-induced protein Ves
MNIQLLGTAQFKSQPWKNGGGSTLELYKYPQHENYDIRLSIATVSSSGPFSKFPGYLRAIIQLEGEPMKLRHPEMNQAKTLERYAPYFFDGEALTDCVVTETARDFNVIYKKNCLVETCVIDLEPGAVRKILGSAVKTFVFCLRGHFMLGNGEIEPSLISEDELCILTKGEAPKEAVMTAGKDGAKLIEVLI